MLEDLQRAGNGNSKSEREVGVIGRKKSVAEKEKEKRPKLSLDMQGTTVWMYGMATPEPSP